MKRPNRCANAACQRRAVTHDRAFCTECFESRHCGGGKSERLLTCKNCGKATLHAVWGESNLNDPYDYGDAKFWHPDAPWTQRSRG